MCFQFVTDMTKECLSLYFFVTEGKNAVKMDDKMHKSDENRNNL